MADEQMKNDIVLNGDGTATWTLDMEGKIHGTYRGTFVFRCFLTPTQTIAAGRELRELLGTDPDTAPKLESYMAFSLTQLKQRIIKAPPFWASTLQQSTYQGDIPDEEVIDAVLNAAVNAELKYKEQLQKKRADILARAKDTAESLLEKQEEDLQREDKNKEDTH